MDTDYYYKSSNFQVNISKIKLSIHIYWTYIMTSNIAVAPPATNTDIQVRAGKIMAALQWLYEHHPGFETIQDPAHTKEQESMTLQLRGQPYNSSN
jgi:hypothetical protein